MQCIVHPMSTHSTSTHKSTYIHQCLQMSTADDSQTRHLFVVPASSTGNMPDTAQGRGAQRAAAAFQPANSFRRSPGDAAAYLSKSMLGSKQRPLVQTSIRVLIIFKK